MAQIIQKTYNFFFKHTFIRYVFIGGSTFVLDFGLLVILHDIFNVNVLIAASISYWSSIVFNFLVNRHWTFESSNKENFKKHLLSYISLLGFNYIFTITFIALTTHLGLHYTIAKVMSVMIQIPWTYYIYKKYVFGTKNIKNDLVKYYKLHILKNWLTKVIILICLVLFTGIFFTAFRYGSLNNKNYVDGSWQYAIASLRHHPEQSLGNDIYFTYGPLSTRMVTAVHHQDGAKDFIIANILVSIIYLLCTYLVYYSIKNANKYIRLIFICFLAAGLLGDPSIDLVFFIVTIIGISSLFKVNGLKQLILLAGPLILSTYKNNLLLAIIGLIILLALNEKKYKRQVIRFAVLFGVLCALLVFTGVLPLNIPRFFYYSFVDAFSYNEYMSLSQNQTYSVTFLLALVIYGCSQMLLLWEKPKSQFSNIKLSDIAPVIAELWILFIVYKEAITRSDGHLIIFLPFAFYMFASIILRLSKKIYELVFYGLILGAFLLIVLFTTYVSGPLGGMSKRIFVIRSYKNLFLYDLRDRYNYDKFLKNKEDSKIKFDILLKESSEVRDQLLHNSALKDHKIIGYTNAIFYLQTLGTEGYLYAPFLQNYTSFPTKLFDGIYKNKLVENPDYLVFIDMKVPSVDNRIPNYDLPETFQYLMQNYSIVARDDIEKLYVFQKSKNTLIKLDDVNTNCETFNTTSFSNTFIELPQNTQEINFELANLKYFLIDTIYKKPVYKIYLYDYLGRSKIYRTTPSILRMGIDTAPFVDTVLTPESESFIVSRVMVEASDKREISIKLSGTTCKQD